MQVLGKRFLCVTPELGKLEMEANTWSRFRYDIWAGQGGNGGAYLLEVAV